MKNILTILIALAVFQVQGQRVDNLITKAIESGKNGDYDNVISYMDKALELEPDNYKALYLKGYAYQNKEDFSTAIKYYTFSLEKRKSNEAYHQRGYCYFRSFQDSLAVVDLSIAIEADSSNFDALMSRVSAFKSMEKYELMLKDMNTYLKKNPNDFFVKANKAIALTLLEKYDEAIILYNDLIIERPNEKKLYHGVSNLYLKTEQLDKALENIEKAIFLDTNYAKGYVLKSEVLMNMNKKELACDAFEKAIKLGIDITDKEFIELQEYCKN